jgi:hypothetical protein
MHESPLTLPSLRDGSLPLPFHGRGAFMSPSTACGRGRDPAEGWEGEGALDFEDSLWT